MITCTSCGTANEPGRKFCVECGQRLAAACPTCGTSNPAGAKFCGECGTALGEASGARASDAAGSGGTAVAATPAPVAERRLVSVMFTDLVGFTTLSEARDAEDTRELLSAYFDAAREIVDRHGGVIEKFIGDAVMAVWGTPTAHEDDAERAVRTALQLVESVGRMEAGGHPLQARAGVLTGEAAVTIGATGQGMVAGDLVNTASRLQSAAAPGTVLVGETTYRAASGAIAFEEAGPQHLKGKEAPVQAWRATEVVARRGGQGRAAILEPPFVGRDEELRLLKDQFHATAREGKPRLVTIAGQAGIGKSRLGWELEKYLDGVVENIWWHEGRSPSYGEGISYWALAEMVRQRAGIAEMDDPETARGRLRQTIEQFVPDPAEQRWIEPRLAGLLGLEELSGDSREELFATWRRFFERMAEQSTVLLVFWDLQWADQGLLDFIEHLLVWARSSPIFVLAEARPELFERRPGWGTSVRSAALIHLEPLDDDAMRHLLVGLVPNLPDQAQQAIVRRAEGVPLYAVETLRILVDRGVLQADGVHYTLVGELPELEVPETLHALIASRLDALDPADRQVITDAAVLGLSFTVPSLSAVANLAPDPLREHLDRLVRHELLVLDVDPRSPERGQYRFVQGVVREVAYQSLAKRDRRAKHIAAARYFESLGEEDLSGVLASHYLAAYRATPAGAEADALAAQGRVALRAAAERAAGMHAYLGALAYLEQALEVTPDPGEQALLHERAAAAATQAAKTDVAVEHAERARALLEARGDRLGVLRTQTLRAWVRLSEHADVDAARILEDALAKVADLPASPEMAKAHSELARALMIAGSPDAVTWADRVLANPELVSSQDLLETIITKGTSLLQVNRIAEGEVTLRGAIVVAERIGNPFAGLRARNNLLGVVELTDLHDALALASEMLEMARRFGYQTWVLQAIGVGERVTFDMGDWGAWDAEIEAERPEEESFYRSWFDGAQANVLAYRGQTEEAERILRRLWTGASVQSSRQATAGIAAQIGDALMAQGRWLEAYEAAREGWTHADMARYASLTSMFAAAAAGDRDRVTEAREAMLRGAAEDLPLSHAIRQIGTTLAELAAARWEHARAGYLAARQLLEPAGQALLLARLQLAVSQLADDRFPEAAEAGRAADAFFAERDAASYVETYRRLAARSATPAPPEAQATSHTARSEPAAR